MWPGKGFLSKLAFARDMGLRIIALLLLSFFLTSIISHAMSYKHSQNPFHIQPQSNLMTPDTYRIIAFEIITRSSYTR
jgi:hypothetical protein